MILTIIIGIIIGSFLNVCISRIPKKESIVFPSSHCCNCGTVLKPFDLIPILSYLFFRGRCRYCNMNISIQYPIIEALTGLIFLLTLNRFELTLNFIFYSILFCTLIVISGIDYYMQIILDKFVIFIFILGFIFKITNYLNYGKSIDIISTLTGLIIGGGFLLLIAIVSKGGVGGGDIKLMAALGFWLGWEYTILSLLLSFIIGGVLSLGLLVLKVKSKKDVIPFGPFLALGFTITVLYGDNIINWYISLFF